MLSSQDLFGLPHFCVQLCHLHDTISTSIVLVTIFCRGEGDGESVEEEENYEDDYPVDPDSFHASENAEFAEPGLSQDEEGEIAAPTAEPHDDPAAANIAENLEAEPSSSVGGEVPSAEGDAPMAEQQDDAPVERSRRQTAGRRGDRHIKSFDFGCFAIRYRDDDSVLYPDRVPSWVAHCPVHSTESEVCMKTIQINQPSEEVSLRRLLMWCLKANHFRSKKESCVYLLSKHISLMAATMKKNIHGPID